MSGDEFEGNVGSGAKPFGFEPIQGSNGGNTIIKDIGPYGNNVLLWKVNGDSGFSINKISVNKAKIYRFSVWLRKDQSDGDSSFEIDNRVICPNANFQSLEKDKWYLFVSYIYSSVESISSESGIYDPESGLKIEGISCNSLTHINVRNNYYLSYKVSFSGGDNDVQYYYAPRADLVDGNEPSIGDLLNPYK
ncbi:hypothetical protein HYW75_05565 [Candidatus Pacearchaeota archaeon]|nr:hypothetical protein [Candidatus Pacearchaeota archaeon]